MGSFDPETIEGDVSYYYKIVYKLEKSFAEVPETHRLAVSVQWVSTDAVWFQYNLYFFIWRTWNNKDTFKTVNKWRSLRATCR